MPIFSLKKSSTSKNKRCLPMQLGEHPVSTTASPDPRWASCVYNCKPWPWRQARVHRHTPSKLKEEPSRPAFQDSHSLASSSHPRTHLTPAWPPSCFFLSLLRMLPLPPSQSNPIYPGRPSSNAINLTRSPQIFPAHFLPCSGLKWQVAMDHTFVTHFELLSFN